MNEDEKKWNDESLIKADRQINTDEVRKWIEENLVRAEEARTITGQSRPAFTQAVRNGAIKPFCTWGEGSGASVLKLYDRESLKKYALTKKRK